MMNMFKKLAIRFLRRTYVKIRPQFVRDVIEIIPFLKRIRDRHRAINKVFVAGIDGEIVVARNISFESLLPHDYQVPILKSDSTPIDLSDISPYKLFPEHWKNHHLWENSIAYRSPKVATLHNVNIFADGSILLQDGRYCMPNPDFFSVRKLMEDHVPIHPNLAIRHIFGGTDDVLVLVPRRRMEISGRIFSTRYMHYNNFGHFIHDCLTRIYYEDIGELVPGREKVIAPVFRFPIQKFLFEKVFENYQIVHFPTNIALIVEELLFPKYLCSLGEFNPFGINVLAKRMRNIMAQYVGSEKYKVCVSRSDGKTDKLRAFSNESDYEMLMQEMGYRIVKVSELGIEAQLKLWANTTDIVGIHGAGMMNMIMMLPGNYTEISSLDGKNSTVRCAFAAGHRVQVVPCTQNPYGNPMIDIDCLMECLQDER